MNRSIRFVVIMACSFILAKIMKNGWVKLHRKLQDNPIYTNSKAVHCWVECLLRASHNEKGMYFFRQKTEIKSGQFCLGRDEFGKSIGMSGSTAWYWLLQFEADRMVDIKKTTKGSIITILKWKEYQIVDSEVANKKTTKKQQKNTNKKYKNVKNVKNNIYVHFQNKINANSRETDKAKIKIKARLKSFTEQELLKAIDNFSKDSWWMEHNSSRGVAWFFHTDERIDQLINLKPRKSEDEIEVPDYARKYQ